MNRSLIAISVGLAGLGLAAGSQLAAAHADSSTDRAATGVSTAGTPTAKAPHYRPFWGEAPCGQGAEIRVKSFYNAAAQYPERVKVRIMHAEPATRLSYSIAIYQGDSGSATGGHRRTDANGNLSITMSGSAGVHQVDVDVTSAAGESCELEISGLVSPLP